jgi:hypothetical protein
MKIALAQAGGRLPDASRTCIYRKKWLPRKKGRELSEAHRSVCLPAVLGIRDREVRKGYLLDASLGSILNSHFDFTDHRNHLISIINSTTIYRNRWLEINIPFLDQQKPLWFERKTC